MAFSCEYCVGTIPSDEYRELMVNPVYEEDKAYIVHQGCVHRFQNVVIQSTEHLCLVKEIEEDE